MQESGVVTATKEQWINLTKHFMVIIQPGHVCLGALVEDGEEPWSNSSIVVTST
jgi:hypothetical protein